MRKNLINAKLASKIATASAVGVLLASQTAYAATDSSAKKTETGLFEFSAVDANNDNRLGWMEIQHPYEDHLSQAGWNQEEVLNKFDANNDDFLNKEEYLSFTSSLTNKTASAGVKETEGLMAADADDEGWFEFDDVDGNNDKSLGWNEINTKYDDQLTEAGWNQEQVFTQFDTNNDKMLNEQEYLTFSSQLQSKAGKVPQTEGMMAADADDEGWFEFDDVDGNNDKSLGWNEINTKYDDQLTEAGWNQEQVFTQFDTNNDKMLNEQEYLTFSSQLQSKAGKVPETEGMMAADADDEGWFEFDDVDGNNDKSLGWNEINTKYDDQLTEAGWNQEQVFAQFDANNDKMLNEQEYLTFSSQLQSKAGNVPETEGMMAADADDEGWFEFDDVDGNNDKSLGWNEINTKYDDQLTEAGWNQEKVFSQFDRNKDQVIDQSEYAILVTGLQEQSGASNGQNQTVQAGDPQAGVVPPVAVITIMTVEQKPQEIKFIELEDKQVINSQGEDVGEVEDVVVRSGGVNETGLVLGVGGFWDMFDTHVYVPLNQIRLEGDTLVMQTALDGEAIQKAAEYEYNEEGYTSLVEDYEEYQAGL